MRYERGSVAKVALVTGASRGIGKAVAIELAKAGFDVAIGARTQSEGERREHSSTIHASDTEPLPGSLAATAEEIRAHDQRVLSLELDLLDRQTLESSVDRVLDEFGRIDVLVNNGRYVGPGVMDLFEDTSIELLERNIEANVLAPVILIKRVLPQMLTRGGGFIVNLASLAGAIDPSAPVGEGFNWGTGYGLSKGAFNRIAGFLAVELGPQGIMAFNVHPGFTITERVSLERGGDGFSDPRWAPPDVTGAAIAWLVTSPEASHLNGTWIEAQDLCESHQLLPGWPTQHR